MQYRGHILLCCMAQLLSMPRFLYSIITLLQREALSRQMEELVLAVREARADRKENERERRMIEVVSAMRKLFPGVHGFVHDLADVTEARWKLALAVVMGRDLDAVVVDDGKFVGVAG